MKFITYYWLSLSSQTFSRLQKHFNIVCISMEQLPTPLLPR